MQATGVLSVLKKVDQSKTFQGFVIFVIIVSALSIGAHTYHLPPWLDQSLWVLDIAITAFFLFELIIRFMASDGIKSFFSKGWNIFDTIIVIGSLVPLGGSTILLARLLRIFRVLRLVSMVPELRMLINALLKAIPRMGYIALLMFVIFYIYGAVGSMFFAHVNDFLWGDVSIAMLTLFRISTFESWTSIMYETMEVYPLSWIYYLTFIFLTTFVFLNMMVGAVLDVMGEETKIMRDEQADENDTPNEQTATAEDIKLLNDKIDKLTEMLAKKA
ncbi:ion transporter [Shewanella sp. 1_MG-2023]|uniref:ion transporter n=1 Tax=unclassified Shewanella TaxID=196818 RepID=UPI0026E11888|nr:MULTISPECIES: ion transporter [unclassified Shewanella]MDO6611536.1 ion transporter [Shewanella sp. 7_MG-2023]MDO6771391.1 ion transporter [Shewanella sp. 2_MG-2023]MDO6793617.1 ion transporter [Shewanella sp. 1_MG-2023]